MKVLEGSGEALGLRVDAVTLGRSGLLGSEEEARVMPALRLAVVRDDQVGWRFGSALNALNYLFVLCIMYLFMYI